MLLWLGIALLGGVGAVARFATDLAVSRRAPAAFPFGTLVVNVSGAFALGVLDGAGAAGDALMLLGTGALGSYTTFSTWLLQSDQLRHEREETLLWLNLAGSLLLGLAAVALGRALGGFIE
jgi:CrcB protein